MEDSSKTQTDANGDKRKPTEVKNQTKVKKIEWKWKKASGSEIKQTGVRRSLRWLSFASVCVLVDYHPFISLWMCFWLVQKFISVMSSHNSLRHFRTKSTKINKQKYKRSMETWCKQKCTDLSQKWTNLNWT